MRSHLAARSARLVLAAAAVTALAATATACGPEDIEDAGSSAAPSAVASAGSDNSSGDSPSTGGSNAAGSTDKKADSGAKTGSGSGDGKKSGYGQSCGTNDLEFTVTSESQAGGYYLVTAKAKSGITCYLDTNTPTVSFGSGADGVASPVGQGGEDPIKLTGSAVAYTGISPKTTNTDDGKEFENVIIATTEDDPNPAELKLPEPADVDKPIVTNWATNRAEAIPVIV
ncbi:hypothetical protein OHU11_07005 [Streptomyces sp. NBC_00257]|uniref:DUF4232 domain-containing protein n=1 Tax=unclassified Streptomyces TaxID=2593676 RepID=UPI002254E8DD|nr:MULTISPECIES: DUF4232 domain-containing protein [unclassified Streptomyces]WTB58515.1 hypothetical protein OG832_37820 [Streptomyces sp. NBC_00826]WTH88605.1 hypothetical protein OIC43_05885 [Streptomyces sp. NBC_00825]WTH97335.1 hypothetical protein OHA23_05890 [Streptomyces sp. NBC_00822]MCX4862842.1 hypothetical protein [Streptomyces sp. NBC_00906]MCX4894079.1 hypothetical protein [Streptomyces sp. NBC_00892]